jgi:hypothetical protein
MEVLSFFQPQNLILKKRKTVFSMERLKERSVDFPEKKGFEEGSGCGMSKSEFWRGRFFCT